MTTTETRRGKRFKELVIEAKSRIEEIDANTLKQWQADNKDMALIDVREPDDYNNGHIEGATPIARGLLELAIDEVVPNQDQTIVLYCGGGSRSALSADTLHTMGYTNVYSLTGGWREWDGPTA